MLVGQKELIQERQETVAEAELALIVQVGLVGHPTQMHLHLQQVMGLEAEAVAVIANQGQVAVMGYVL